MVRPQFTAIRAVVPPVIDGNIGVEEWAGSNVYVGDATLVAGPGPYDAKDFFTIYALYDDSYLYLGIKIKDPIENIFRTPAKSPTGYTPDRWGWDGLYIYFDQGAKDPLGGGTRDYKLSTDKDYRVSLTIGDGRTPRVGSIRDDGAVMVDRYWEHGDHGLIPTDGLEVAARHHVDQWEFELKIPIRLEGFINIDPRTNILGFYLVYTNNDGECLTYNPETGACSKGDVVGESEYHVTFPDITMVDGARQVEKWVDLSFGGGDEVNTLVSKTHTLTKDVTVNYQWVLATAEPTAPTGYTRLPEADVDLGEAGKLWAFVQVT